MTDVQAIYGIDFSGAKDAGNKIWIAKGVPRDGKLLVSECLKARDLPNSGRQVEDCLPSLVDVIKSNRNSAFGISKEFDEAVLKIKECLDWKDEEKALNYLGEGWIGEEAVALALYCFLKYLDDHEKMVIRGANTNGDSDSIACIGGSISGAYLGIGAIPDQCVKEIEKSEYLNDLATRLAEKKDKL